jgi:hypothetical protein
LIYPSSMSNHPSSQTLHPSHPCLSLTPSHPHLRLTPSHVVCLGLRFQKATVVL